MKKNELVSIRPHESPADDNFIFVHWMRGLRKDNDLFRLISRDIYEKNYRPLIALLLTQSETKIACLKDSPEVILGFSVFTPERIHWVYVKEDWRRIGIAMDLLPSTPKYFTHMTAQILPFIQNKFPKIIFNPFLNGKEK